MSSELGTRGVSLTLLLGIVALVCMTGNRVSAQAKDDVSPLAFISKKLPTNTSKL